MPRCLLVLVVASLAAGCGQGQDRVRKREARDYLAGPFETAFRRDTRAQRSVSEFGHPHATCQRRGQGVRCEVSIDYRKGGDCTRTKRTLYFRRARPDGLDVIPDGNPRITHDTCNLGSDGRYYVDSEYGPFE